MKIEKIYISNYKNLKNLEMDFKKDNKILDLVILTGSNGSGKTRILECILNCFEDYIKKTKIDWIFIFKKMRKNVLMKVLI